MSFLTLLQSGSMVSLNSFYFINFSNYVSFAFRGMKMHLKLKTKLVNHAELEVLKLQERRDYLHYPHLIKELMANGQINLVWLSINGMRKKIGQIQGGPTGKRDGAAVLSTLRMHHLARKDGTSLMMTAILCIDDSMIKSIYWPVYFLDNKYLLITGKLW